MPQWREGDDSADLDDVERRLRAIRDDPEKSATLRALAQYQLERIAGLRAAETRSGSPRTPVAVRRLGPITFSTITGTSVVGIEIDREESLAPLAAIVSADEVRLLTPLFEYVWKHAEPGDPLPVDVRAAFLDLIGHDPFDGQIDG